MPPKNKKEVKGNKGKDPKLDVIEQEKLNEVVENGLFEGYEYIVKNLLKHLNLNTIENFNIYEFASNRLIKFEPKYKIKYKQNQRKLQYKNLEKKKLEEKEKEEKLIQEKLSKLSKKKKETKNNDIKKEENKK